MHCAAIGFWPRATPPRHPSQQKRKRRRRQELPHKSWTSSRLARRAKQRKARTTQLRMGPARKTDDGLHESNSSACLPVPSPTHPSFAPALLALTVGSVNDTPQFKMPNFGNWPDMINAHYGTLAAYPATTGCVDCSNGTINRAAGSIPTRFSNEAAMTGDCVVVGGGVMGSNRRRPGRVSK